ncbi:hypothetical protein TNCT_129031, partial [Trichonephila clavata]
KCEETCKESEALDLRRPAM